MGIAKKTDGRYVVGLGVNNANEYKGSASYRDIYIQLTSSGATEKSEEYLTFLKDYGFHANAQGEPIMPPSVNVWISNNGVTTAVEADDVSIDGNNYTICGIVWNGSSWDYSNAGQGGGGGGLPEYTSADKGKVLALGEGSSSTTEVIVPEQTITEAVKTATLTNVNWGSTAIGDTVRVMIVGETSDVIVSEYNGMRYVAYSTYFIDETADGATLTTTDSDANLRGVSVSLTASVPSVEPKWEQRGGVVTITLPDELNTLLMTTLQSRAPAAISAGVGNLVYTQGSYSSASDTDALSALISAIADAKANNAIIRLSGGTVVTECGIYDGGSVYIGFTYSMLFYSTYVFKTDLEINASGIDGYMINSTITLLHTQGGN